MVGGRDGDRVDVLPLFLEQHAKIFEALGLGERRVGRRRLVLVHVAQRVDVRSGLRDALYVVCSHAAHPIRATLTVSLGARRPRPSTCGGTMANATPAPPSPTNLRLE